MKSIDRYGVEEYERLKERQRKSRRQIYRDNGELRERRLESNRLFKRNNPDYVALHNSRRRARKLEAGGTYTVADIHLIHSEQNNICPGCFRKFSEDLPYTVDHFIPLARGGSNSSTNIQLACGSCNYSRSDKLWSEWA